MGTGEGLHGVEWVKPKDLDGLCLLVEGHVFASIWISPWMTSEYHHRWSGHVPAVNAYKRFRFMGEAKAWVEQLLEDILERAIMGL